MNKTTKLIAAAILALPMGLQAQTVRLDFSSYTTESSAASISLSDNNGFTVEGASNASSAAFDTNSSNFAFSAEDEEPDWAFSTAIRWKPATGLNNASRWMTITVPSAGTLCIYARNSNGSNTDRTLTITQNDQVLYGPTAVKDEDAFRLANNKQCFPIISAEVKAGTITVNTSGSINFYGFAFTPTAAVNVEVEVTDAKYATFANNGIKSMALPEGLTAYGVSAVADGKVTFTEYNVIPVGVGVILSGNAGKYTLEPTDEACTYTSDNLLVAVTADMTVPEKADGKLNYIFANKEQGVGFYKSSGTGTIAKGKAYLSIVDESADNREWDFTTKKIWSEATIANLEVEREAATTWTTNAGDADAGWRYMYNAATTTEEMTANGEKIAELEGLFFRGSANRLGIDNRSTNRFYLAGNKFYVVIPDLKAGSTVTISTKSSSNSANAKMTCDSENVVAQEADDAIERDNVFTINAFGSYEFQPDRGLYITKITVSSEGGAAAREFIGFGSDETTGIKIVENESKKCDHAVYTISGQRVQKPGKGLCIVNGRKVILK
ncbi:MAG: hypothetical protein J6I52_02975 [Prevotella sp.]|nr:hypothetical protein [Prevotella sp.]